MSSWTPVDGAFAFYASRPRLRAWPRAGVGGVSWTGSLLSTPLATNFGPGPERASEGCAAGRVAFTLASRHKPLLRICTYTKHPQPHPKTPVFLA